MKELKYFLLHITAPLLIGAIVILAFLALYALLGKALIFFIVFVPLCWMIGFLIIDVLSLGGDD